MEVKPGYKQTEVGVIPEEWEVSGLQQACRETITYGIVQCGPHIRDGVPYIRVSDMGEPELAVDAMLRTSKSIASKFARSTVEEGDLVYALRGKLGEVRQVRAPLAGANLTQGTARLAPNDLVVGGYFLWTMRDPRALRQAELEAKGTTFREITLADLRRIKVLLPPLPEQRAIATALNDVDGLLGGLDRLIAKKRDLKQAAMQQLLTGQIRLPDFSVEWEVKRLGDVVEIKKGQLITSSTLKQGDIPVIAGGKQPAYFHYSANRFGRTVTISASGASAGYVALYDEPIFASDCSTISESETYCLDFIFYQLLWKQQTIYKAQTGGAQPHIHAKDLNPILFVFPNLSEQTAIAKVLQEMEVELAVLEQRREKTSALKQAMMQELLTGRTRLLSPEPAHA